MHLQCNLLNTKNDYELLQSISITFGLTVCLPTLNSNK